MNTTTTIQQQQHNNNTTTQQQLVASIDWSSFTFPATQSPRETKEFLRLLCPSEYTTPKHGGMGYQTLEIGVFGHQILSSDRRPEHHVVLPGQYCRQLGRDRMLTLLSWVLNNNGKFTRLDVALDDYTRIKTPSQIMRSINRGEMVTPMRDAHQHNQFRGKPGQGLYFGSPTSDRRLRIYDKYLEDPEYNCIRWEIQNRDKYAHDTAVKIIESTDAEELYRGMLLGCIDFRVPRKSQKNKQRRARTSWFKKLVGLCGKVQYYLGKAQASLTRMRSWLERQVAPTLAVVLDYNRGDISFFADLVETGKKRWKAAHRIALTTANNERDEREATIAAEPAKEPARTWEPLTWSEQGLQKVLPAFPYVLPSIG